MDVLVVGAGPAGAVTALGLARAGLEVAIVEHARFPRRKVCGEYVNAGAVRLLDALGVGGNVRAEASSICGVRLVPPAGPAALLPLRSPALAIARERLDELLLDAACAAGASVRHARAERLVFERGRACGVTVRDESGDSATLRARFVVGADGCGSAVARSLGLVRPSRGPRRFAVGGHYRGFGAMDGHVEMYVGTGAYFAINPLTSECANVMVVVREGSLAQWSRDVDGGIRGTAAELGRGRRSFEGTQRIGARAAVGPLSFNVRRSTAPGAVLVGDASGSLDPFTGQGVYLALDGAIDAAQTIERAVRSRAREPRELESYETRRTRELQARRRLSSLVGLLIDAPLLARRAASRLERRPERADGLLAVLGGLRSARPLPALSLARLLW